jgi:ATP-binding protein involved in chromosome partitioning
MNPAVKQRLPGVKHIVAIASGKGGVGKSTTTANLALALARDGARVAILDADIYGPNQAQMLGASGRPEIVEPNRLKPVMAHGIQTMSMAYLMDDNKTPMIWRGPMVSRALEQLLFDTLWEDVDYLLLDCPPGTGDIQLTMAQKIPLSGAVIVTTPQEVALLDARKAFAMFQKVNVPVLGVIENMSHFHCPCCGHDEAVFGQQGGVAFAQAYQVPLLAQLPLATAIQANADAGKPLVLAEPDSDIAKRYHQAADQLVEQLALQPTDYAAKFPEIIVENT